jgi:hypothetical protein
MRARNTVLVRNYIQIDGTEMVMAILGGCNFESLEMGHRVGNNFVSTEVNKSFCNSLWSLTTLVKKNELA